MTFQSHVLVNGYCGNAERHVCGNNLTRSSQGHLFGCVCPSPLRHVVEKSALKSIRGACGILSSVCYKVYNVIQYSSHVVRDHAYRIQWLWNGKLSCCPRSDAGQNSHIRSYLSWTDSNIAGGAHGSRDTSFFFFNFWQVPGTYSSKLLRVRRVSCATTVRTPMVAQQNTTASPPRRCLGVCGCPPPCKPACSALLPIFHPSPINRQSSPSFIIRHWSFAMRHLCIPLLSIHHTSLK